MSITLRPYQADALEAVQAAFREQKHVLLQAATGAGKTIIFSELIREFRTKYSGLHILIVAHREQLVRQAVDKLLKVWPEGAGQIGIACSSVASRSELDKPVIIGSIQTVARRLNDLPSIHLMIVDEVHRMPPLTAGTRQPNQYEQVVERLTQYYDKMRLLGVTATPYRLGWGYIYGSIKTGDPERNWFPNLTYAIGIDTLQEQGFLCPLQGWGTNKSLDLSNVLMSANGDYREDSLAKCMSEEVHIGSAVKAVQSHAQDRRHIVVFAVTIEHAGLLTNAFQEAGFTAGITHSELNAEDNARAMQAFESGELRVLVNVGKLTEGWDCPATDCVVLCRPTKSTALYVQMVGRGLRLAEGKKDCLLLDLAGCWQEHGDPASPRVSSKPAKKYNECPECHFLNPKTAEKCENCGFPLKNTNSEVEQPFCPNCQGLITRQMLQCPWCGEWLMNINNSDPSLYKLTQTYQPVAARLLGSPSIKWEWQSRKSGNHMAYLSMTCQLDEDTLPVRVSDYWDIEGEGSTWGRTKARQRWRELAQTEPPETLFDARMRQYELKFPDHITIQQSKDGKYWNVVRYTA